MKQLQIGKEIFTVALDIEGRPQILVAGNWMKPIEFVHWLTDNDMRETMEQLFKHLYLNEL
jgi:hypothetical protein